MTSIDWWLMIWCYLSPLIGVLTKSYHEDQQAYSRQNWTCSTAQSCKIRPITRTECQTNLYKGRLWRALLTVGVEMRVKDKTASEQVRIVILSRHQENCIYNLIDSRIDVFQDKCGDIASREAVMIERSAIVAQDSADVAGLHIPSWWQFAGQYEYQYDEPAMIFASRSCV